MESAKQILADLKRNYSQVIKADQARKEAYNALLHKFKKISLE